jgi:hypothetical protein
VPEWVEFALCAVGTVAGSAMLVYLLSYSLVHNRWPWDRGDLD